MRNPILCFLVILLGGALALRSARADELRAGCSMVDISPHVLPAIRNGGFLEQTTDRIDDPLFARTLALANADQTLVLTFVDSCMIPRDLCDTIKQNVSAKTGLPTSSFLIAATHTHSAPSAMDFCLGCRKDPVYGDLLIAQVCQGIETALTRLRPAKIGWTVVDAPDHTHCRRWLKRPEFIGTDPFGLRTVRAMMHPGYQNPEYSGPSGPVDSQLSLIQVQTAEGQPLCLLANYSMHYFGADGFSADYFGDFAREMESAIQPQIPSDPSQRAVGIMSQGTSGDQHWMDYRQPQRADYSRKKYAAELAAIAIKALPQIQYQTEVRLAVAQTELRLHRRTPNEERLAWANELNRQRGEKRPANLPEVYAEQAVWLRQHPEADLLLQAMRIGDLGIAAIPNEVFGITGLKLKAQSPLQPLVNMELANGAEGYIPPPEQHRLGGYTTWPARTAGLEEEAEPKIVDGLLKLLEQLSDGASRRALTVDFYNDEQRKAIERSRDQ